VADNRCGVAWTMLPPQLADNGDSRGSNYRLRSCSIVIVDTYHIDGIQPPDGPGLSGEHGPCGVRSAVESADVARAVNSYDHLSEKRAIQRPPADV
jgi:hypothetical protein